MSDEKKPVEAQATPSPQPAARPMRHNLKPEEGAPRTSTLTFEPDNLASVEAAMRVLKQCRADIAAAERAAIETAETQHLASAKKEHAH